MVVLSFASVFDKKANFAFVVQLVAAWGHSFKEHFELNSSAEEYGTTRQTTSCLIRSIDDHEDMSWECHSSARLDRTSSFHIYSTDESLLEAVPTLVEVFLASRIGRSPLSSMNCSGSYSIISFLLNADGSTGVNLGYHNANLESTPLLQWYRYIDILW